MCFSALLACLGSLYPTPRHLSNLKFPLGSAGTLGTLGLMWSRLQPAVDSFPRVVGRQMEPGMEDLKDSPWGRGGGLGAGKAPQACSVSGNLATTPSHTSFRTLNRAHPPSPPSPWPLTSPLPPQPAPPITGVSVWALLGFYPEAVRGERRGLCTWGEGHRVHDAGWGP
jgi:hypothetical protein